MRWLLSKTRKRKPANMLKHTSLAFNICTGRKEAGLYIAYLLNRPHCLSLLCRRCNSDQTFCNTHLSSSFIFDSEKHGLCMQILFNVFLFNSIKYKESSLRKTWLPKYWISSCCCVFHYIRNRLIVCIATIDDIDGSSYYYTLLNNILL